MFQRVIGPLLKIKKIICFKHKDPLVNPILVDMDVPYSFSFNKYLLKFCYLEESFKQVSLGLSLVFRDRHEFMSFLDGKPALFLLQDCV